MSVRDFKKSDLDDLLEVASVSFVEELEISGFDPDHIRKTVNKMFNVFGRIFLAFLSLFGKEPFKFLVAEAEGRVVGTTMVNNRGSMGYISTVMVHPTYRRKGIATQLMKSALNYIQRKKLDRAVLHVVSTNVPAKSLYHKLGFNKIEDSVYMAANVHSFEKPENLEGIEIKNFNKGDIEAVYNLIKCSESPDHLKVFDFKKKDLETPFIKRIIRLSTVKKIVAVKYDKIVGYAQASYTTDKEAGRITNIQVYPEMRSKGIEEMLVYAAIEHIREVGAKKAIATTLSTRQKLIKKMERLGFEKHLETEAMALEL